MVFYIITKQSRKLKKAVIFFINICLRLGYYIAAIYKLYYGVLRRLFTVGTVENVGKVGIVSITF